MSIRSVLASEGIRVAAAKVSPVRFLEILEQGYFVAAKTRICERSGAARQDSPVGVVSGERYTIRPYGTSTVAGDGPFAGLSDAYEIEGTLFWELNKNLVEEVLFDGQEEYRVKFPGNASDLVFSTKNGWSDMVRGKYVFHLSAAKGPLANWPTAFAEAR